MSKGGIGEKVFSNLIWRFAERCGAQLVTFTVSIILARLLAPEVYGIIALVSVFTSILQVFVDSGLGNALIQKKDVDDIDFSTVFYSNIVFCIVIYLLLFLLSPVIADFYEIPELVSVVRVLGLTIIVSGIKNVQQAYVSRKMIFKKFFYATLAGTIVAAVTGILMAYCGLGVWALVGQNLMNLCVDTIFLWITVGWKPQFVFSWRRLKGLYSYGWKMLVSSLLHTIYVDIRQLIIGKLYSSADLALYNKGKLFPGLIVTNINNSINSVLFPAMSDVQEDREMVKKMTRMSIRVSGYVMWPMMLGLVVIAEPLVLLLLTERWRGCIPFLKIFCITNAFSPIQTANLNAIKAMGHSDLYLRMEIIKKTVGIIILLLVMRHGVMVIAYSLLVYSLFSQVINAWPNRKLLGYSYLDQLRDIMPFIMLSFVMCIPVFFIGRMNLPKAVILILQVIVGAIVYLGESIILKLDTYYFVLEQVKALFVSKKCIRRNDH